jgi:uncharacterized OB-fold protein
VIADLWLRCVLRPLGKLIGTDRWEPCIVYEGRCLSCGDGAVYVIPADTPCLDVESGAIFGTQCPACGEMAVTSL